MMNERSGGRIYGTVFSMLLPLLFLGCGKGDVSRMRADYPFFLGTYTEGSSEGIYRYRLNKDGSLDSMGLEAVTTGPSFLAKAPGRNIVLAVNEVDNDGSGTVESYRIIGDSLEFLSRSSSGGAHPCFVNCNADGYVLAANYSGGNVGLLKLQDDGILSPLLSTLQHKGSGSHPRQKGPHAHSAYFSPVNDSAVISVDLGANKLYFSTINKLNNILIGDAVPELKMPEAVGPRHLAFSASGEVMYAANELESSVTVVRRGPEGRFIVGETLSTLPADFNGGSFCGDIHLSPDGKFLYISNRGHDSITVFAVDAVDGGLRTVARESVRGSWPRNFAITADGRYLLTANQKSENIVSFLRDPATGKLTYIDEISAPTPVCILF